MNFSRYNSIFIMFFFLACGTITAQNYSISGYVEDVTTGERIIGAYIYDSISGNYTSTNNFGYFILKNNGPGAVLISSYVGCISEANHFTIIKDTLVILKINTVAQIKEVTISAYQGNMSVNSTLGHAVIPVKSLLMLPAMGEADLIKSIQSQPGIKGGIEGSAGIYVRGGGGGENLFMLDDVPVYNVSHLYGFFSAFNSSAIKDIKLLKGCFPSRYGGRASSVIDVRSKDGNSQSLAGEIAVGLISSRFTIEGSIIKEKTTFILSGRRSYFDLLSNPFKKINIINDGFPDYYFYDLNARITHSIGKRDRLYLNFYKGSDYIKNTEENTEISGTSFRFDEHREETSGWGNLINSARWNHAFASGMFMNTTLAYSKYDYFSENRYSGIDLIITTNENTRKEYNASYTSDITDLLAKVDFDVPVSDNYIKMGAGNIYHSVNPGKNNFRVNDQSTNENFDTSYANNVLYFNEPYVYYEFELKSVEKLMVNAGMRHSAVVSSGDKYFYTEPRLSLNILVLPGLAVKTGYSRMIQYMHLLSSYGVSLPTDIWVPALQGLKPLKSDQVNIGISYNINEQLFLSAEVYQKWLTNTADYKNGASLTSDLSPWYTKTTQGAGLAKGLEVSAIKQEGNVKGSINYTLAKAERKYTDINDGKSFPFKYDRLHDLSVSVNYQVSEKIDISAVWCIGSGYPVTLPVEKYLPALGIYNLNSEYGGEIDYFPSRNNYRLPVYHRLDIGMHYKKKSKIGEHNLSFDIFNAYNRKNPVYAYYSGYRVKTLQYANLLPIIPGITYSFKFN